MKHGLKVLFLVFSLGLSSACERKSGEPTSAISIRMPKLSGLSKDSAQAAIPAGKKACFGVQVTGPGIPNFSSSCGYSLGLTAGFAEENSTLSLVIPKGSDRNFELFIHLVDAATSCPETFNASMMEKSSFVSQLYRAGKTENVTLALDEETVLIKYAFPGETQSIATENSTANSCLAGSKLKGSLYSNGDIVDAAGSVLAGSAPINDSFYLTGISDIYGVGIITTGGILNLPSVNFAELPPEIFSVTRKPDSGAYYGLLHSGKIVEITLSGAVGSYAELTGANCPFAVANCEVPVWMQSISAGYGTELYGLDHGGAIYQIQAADASPTGITVPQNVTQVSFY